MINGINHLTFSTSHLGESLEFYIAILGGELIARWDRGAYLLLGNLWLCLSRDKNTKTSLPGEYTHIAFDISSANFNAIKKIIQDNSVPIWKENKSEGESLYILDPDYNKLEIHASDLKSRIESMLSKPFSGMVLNKKAIKKLGVKV